MDDCVLVPPAPPLTPSDLGTGDYVLGSDCLWHWQAASPPGIWWLWLIPALFAVVLVVALVRRTPPPHDWRGVTWPSR